MGSKTSAYTPLGEEIQRHLDRLQWSQRALAAAAGTSSGTISKLMRGEHQPTPETLDAIGRALEVDPLHLMRLGGIPVPLTKSERDPEIEYLAQQLQELPPVLREMALEMCMSLIQGLTRLRRSLLQGGLTPTRSETRESPGLEGLGQGGDDGG